jgi:hypothetical protein
MSSVATARHDQRALLQRAMDALCHAPIGTAPLLWRNLEVASRRQSTDPGSA